MRWVAAVTKGRQLPFRVVGLFSGIGGFELGLERAGCKTALLCEKDPVARRVLESRFPKLEVVEDVEDLRSLHDVDMLTAGFPCQDLSQAGRRRGISGSKSSIVRRVFELLERNDVPWVLIENVPFMLWLQGGSAIKYLISEFERLGYRWAYRVIDTRAFGLPQRRQRVFLLASRSGEPARALLGPDADNLVDRRAAQIELDGRPLGFYWTEGNRGVGWAEDAIPALKPGSGKGIPSPPAILFPSGFIGLPDIEDAEALQGFPRGWSSPAEGVARRRYRWKLVGNAVSVPVVKWIGERVLSEDDEPRVVAAAAWGTEDPSPRAAFGAAGDRFSVAVGPFPVRRRIKSLARIVTTNPRPLSSRATKGFAARLERSSLDKPKWFLDALRQHWRQDHKWTE